MVTNNSANIPTGASGTVLRGQGIGSNSAFSTATYPATTTVSQILYSSSSNTVAGLATANSGVLTTSSGGVPSIDTTNFAVLSTGVQMKGNNTNTAPPAGFIGEQIRGAATAQSVTSTTPANITSISLTAGIWDISALTKSNSSNATGTISQIGISTNSASFTGTVAGDSTLTIQLAAYTAMSLSIPSFRVTLSATTTYYLVGRSDAVSGTLTMDGRISGTRVG